MNWLRCPISFWYLPLIFSTFEYSLDPQLFGKVLITLPRWMSVTAVSQRSSLHFLHSIYFQHECVWASGLTFLWSAVIVVPSKALFGIYYTFIQKKEASTLRATCFGKYDGFLMYNDVIKTPVKFTNTSVITNLTETFSLKQKEKKQKKYTEQSMQDWLWWKPVILSTGLNLSAKNGHQNKT